MKRARGQALTEFAVGVAALSLLGIGTLTIAGFQEAQRRAVAGARHALFESIWRNGRAMPVAPEQLIHRIHFDDPGYVRPVAEPRWIHASDVGLGGTHQSPPGHAATATEALLTPLQVVGGFLGSAFDLSNTGFSTTTLRVQLPASQQLPEPFADLDLAVSQSMAMLSDAWNASGSPHVLSRASGLVPTRRLIAVSTLWRPLATPLALLEPGLDQLCLGLIDPEALPEDRLGSATASVPNSVVCR